MENKKRLKKSRYITGFNGIRTLAVIGVIMYHLLPTTMKGGYLGVTLFFVVSGYLITDLLRQEWQQNGKINIKQFYIRRIKRLYPAMVAMLVASTAYITLFQRNLLNNIRGVTVSTLAYVNNWWQIKNGMSYFDRFASESPFTHLWSLSVEGQYYLFWPLLFAILVYFMKRRDRIFFTLIGLALLSAIWMAILFKPGSDPTRVYYGTDTRIFSALIGSALAFIWPSTRLKHKIPVQAKRLLNGVGLGSIVLLTIMFFFLDDTYNFVYYGGMFLSSILAMLLVAVTAHPGASLNKWLTNPVFEWIGKRSYGIYLYQFPIMIFYEAKISNISDHIFIHTVIEIILILAVTELSYRFIEQPLAHFDYRQSWTTLKNLFREPLSLKQPWRIPVLFVCLVAIVGFVIAPKNEVTAEQKQLQEQIAKNKEAADQKRENAIAGTTPSSSEPEAKPTTPAATDLVNYGLSDAQLSRAKSTELTVFGDSVILAASAPLQEVFTKMVMDADVGRQLYDSTPGIESLKQEDVLAKNVLISLGTNGSFSEEQFDTFMAAIGTDHQVFWVNTHVPTKRWQNQVNDMLAKMAKKYDNLTLIDWYDASKDHEDWFYEDRVHPNELGVQQYTSLVAKTILKNTQ